MTSLPMPDPAVLISEVGPRDGLQSVARTMPTTAKLAWIDARRRPADRDPGGLLPLSIGGRRLPLRQPPPALGEHSDTLRRSLGYGREEIDALVAAHVVGAPTHAEDAGSGPASA